YWIEYTFLAGNNQFKNLSRIRRAFWQQLHEGDAIRVTYLAKNPRIALPYARASLTVPVTLAEALDDFEMVLLLFIPLMLLLFWLNMKRRVWLDLARNGVAAIGEVTEIRGAKVKYAFEGPAGTQSGSFFFAEATVPRPSVGDHFVVIYD